jgi:hypothetical protein
MGFNKRLFVGASGITATDHFAVNIWSGNGASDRTIATGFNMATDGGFAWVKKRTGSGGKDHILSHSLDGTADPFFLYPNLALVETAAGANNQIQDFVSTGFTVNPSAYTNASSSTYVSWSWKGGGITPSSLSGGTITPSASVNVDAGFSIMTYTGANVGTGNVSTIPHGLSQAPELIIIKGRDVAAGWPTLYNDGTNSYAMRLNSNGTNDDANKNTFFGNGSSHTAPTSSLFTVGHSDEVNFANNYLAFCYHSVAGYSKIGKYTGKAGVAEHEVNLGFAPAFVLIKRTDVSSNWGLFDYKRDSGTGERRVDHRLESNTDDLEEDVSGVSNGEFVRFTDTGLKFPTYITNADTNANNGNYIYMAFAR